MKSPPVSVGSLRGTSPRGYVSRERGRRSTLETVMLAAPPRIDGDVVGLAAARQSLRDQIARLERELAVTLAQTYPFVAVPLAIEHHGPRLLGLEELERTRDALADRLARTRRRAQRQRAVQVEA